MGCAGLRVFWGIRESRLPRQWPLFAPPRLLTRAVFPCCSLPPCLPAVRGLYLLTAKPMVYAANVAEDDLAKPDANKFVQVWFLRVGLELERGGARATAPAGAFAARPPAPPHPPTLSMHPTTPTYTPHPTHRACARRRRRREAAWWWLSAQVSALHPRCSHLERMLVPPARLLNAAGPQPLPPALTCAPLSRPPACPGTQVEAELNGLDREEAAEYLEALGVEEGGLKSLIRCGRAGLAHGSGGVAGWPSWGVYRGQAGCPAAALPHA